MNSSQVARIRATVKPLALLLLVTACGAAESGTMFEETPSPIAEAGSGGSGPASSAGSGGSVSDSGSPAIGGTSAGSAGRVAGSGPDGAPDATGGQPGGTAGMVSTAGMAAGGATTAGSGGMAHAGAAQAGSGGQVSDPLEPKPVPGCPGYVKITVPHGTCVWFHGSFTVQSEQCNISSPSPRTCSTASAVSGDTSGIVSEGVEFERFDFDATGCPKKCG